MYARVVLIKFILRYDLTEVRRKAYENTNYEPSYFVDSYAFLRTSLG